MARLKVGVLISGRGSNLQALLDACGKPGFPAEIAVVLSNVADAYGLERAKAAGVPTAVLSHKDFASREDFDRAMDASLREAGVEFICLAGFMRLLSPWFVEAWEGRMINIHPSLLPAFTGLHTHERAIAAGVRFSGCTVHFVTAELDAGPIIVQAAVPIHSDDTPDRLAARVLESEHHIYPAALQMIAAGKAKLSGDRVQIEAAAAPDHALINPLP